MPCSVKTCHAECFQFMQEFDLHDSVGNRLFEDDWSSGRYHLEINDVVPFG